jgi:hypothetical protein
MEETSAFEHTKKKTWKVYILYIINVIKKIRKKKINENKFFFYFSRKSILEPEDEKKVISNILKKRKEKKNVNGEVVREIINQIKPNLNSSSISFGYISKLLHKHNIVSRTSTLREFSADTKEAMEEREKFRIMKNEKINTKYTQRFYMDETCIRKDAIIRKTYKIIGSKQATVTTRNRPFFENDADTIVACVEESGARLPLMMIKHRRGSEKKKG